MTPIEDHVDKDPVLKIRTTPTGLLPEDEEHKVVEDICEALIQYAWALGINMDIRSVNHAKSPKSLEVLQALTELQVAVSSAVVTHGCFDDIEDMVVAHINNLQPPTD